MSVFGQFLDLTGGVGGGRVGVVEGEGGGEGGGVWRVEVMVGQDAEGVGVEGVREEEDATGGLRYAELRGGVEGLGIEEEAEGAAVVLSADGNGERVEVLGVGVGTVGAMSERRVKERKLS